MMTISKEGHTSAINRHEQFELLVRSQFDTLLAQISGNNEDSLPSQPPLISDSVMPRQSMAVVGLRYAGYTTEIFDDGDIRSDSPHVDDDYYVEPELIDHLISMMGATDGHWDELHPERELTGGEISRKFSPIAQRAIASSLYTERG